METIAKRNNTAMQRRIAAYYTKHGNKKTLKHFGIHTSPLYNALRATGTPLKRPTNGTQPAAKPPTMPVAVASGNRKFDMATLVLARKLRKQVVARIAAKAYVGPLEMAALTLVQHLLGDEEG